MSLGGVYEIVNKINGKRYVGSSSCIRRRWSTHRSLLHNGKHYNAHIQRAYDKYGERNFLFRVIVYADVEEYIRIENLLLASGDYEYNIAKDAVKPALGLKLQFSDEHKRNLSEAKSGEKHHLYGKTLPKEWRENISKGRTGKHHTKETRQKMSRNHADASGENNPMYGRHHSEEVKQRLSECHTGMKHSEESKRKMSLAQRGENSPSAILNKEQVLLIRKMAKEAEFDKGDKMAFCRFWGKKFNVSCVTIKKVVNNYTWKHLLEA
jgi:hypothetical protein